MAVTKTPVQGETDEGGNLGKWKRVVIFTWKVGDLPGEWPVKVACETKVGTSRNMFRKKVQN